MENESYQEYKKLVAEITEGAEQVKQLRASSSSANQEWILESKMASYEEALSILNGKATEGQTQSVIFSSSDSPDSSASLTTGFQQQDFSSGAQRFRRRKGERLILRTVAVSELNDGHQWRKYGQKDILGSAYPRSYYRCVHKSSQGCQATKHVHQSDDDPSKWEIMYCNQHTCTGQPAALPPALLEKQI